MIKKDIIITLASTIIGSIGEELLEIIQTSSDGVSPEYRFAGEAIGAILGFLTAKFVEREEFRIAIKTFSKSLFKHVMKSELNEMISEEEINNFQVTFNKLTQEQKMKNINAFKVAYPYEYKVLFYQEV